MTLGRTALVQGSNEASCTLIHGINDHGPGVCLNGPLVHVYQTQDPIMKLLLLAVIIMRICY
jgi:hypothetical protein